jgi:hypothetical protein
MTLPKPVFGTVRLKGSFEIVDDTDSRVAEEIIVNEVEELRLLSQENQTSFAV